MRTLSLALALVVTAAGCAGPSGPSPVSLPTSYPKVTPAPGDAFAQQMWELAGSGDPANSPIHAVWRVLAERGIEYTSPRAVVPYRPGEAPPTACRDQKPVEEWANNAFYCRIDSTIAYDEVFLRSIHDDLGGLAAAGVLAHEWGHHLQNLTDRGQYSIQNELQADCYAGGFFGMRGYEGLAEDSIEAMGVAFKSGNEDYHDSRWFLTNEHGSPTQRSGTWATGYLSSLLSPEICGGYDDWKPGQRVDFGPHWITELPGRKGTLTDGVYILVDDDLPKLSIERVPLLAEVDMTPAAQAEAMLRERMGSRLAFKGGPYQHVFPETALWIYGLDVDGDPSVQEEHGTFSIYLPPEDPGMGLVVQTVGEGTVRPDATGAEAKDMVRATEIATSAAIMAVARICASHQSFEADAPFFSTSCAENQ